MHDAGQERLSHLSPLQQGSVWCGYSSLGVVLERTPLWRDSPIRSSSPGLVERARNDGLVTTESQKDS